MLNHLSFLSPWIIVAVCEAVVRIRIMSESHLVQNSGNHYYYSYYYYYYCLSIQMKLGIYLH